MNTIVTLNILKSARELQKEIDRLRRDVIIDSANSKLLSYRDDS